MFPGDSFSLIFLLFLPQHQLDKQLLQFLITVVNAELFKAVAQDTEIQTILKPALYTYKDTLTLVAAKVFCPTLTCCFGKSQSRRCPTPR